MILSTDSFALVDFWSSGAKPTKAHARVRVRYAVRTVDETTRNYVNVLHSVCQETQEQFLLG